MSVVDYRINAEVRRHLVSRWVDVTAIQIGTTNGVVYLLGRLDTTMEDPERRTGESRRQATLVRMLRLAIQLERELRKLRDVRDVVFKFDNVTKRGGRWRAADGARSVTMVGSAISGKSTVVNSTFELEDDSENEEDGKSP